MSHMVYSDHIAITSGDSRRPREANILRESPVPGGSGSRRVIISSHNVTTTKFGKIIPPSPSASQLDGLQITPPGTQPLVHGSCQLELPACQGAHGSGHLSH